MPSAASGSRLDPSAVLWLALLAVLVLALVVSPLAAILYRAFVDVRAGSTVLTGANFVRVLSDSIYWSALLNTLIVSCAAALIATVFGSSLAWMLVRTNTPCRTVLERVCEMPIFVPPFVGAVAWALLFAPRIGVFNRILLQLGMGFQLDVYSLTGMACVIGIYLAPYAMLIVASALRGMDPSLEEAARVCGLGTGAAVLRVTLPLLAPALTSSLVLSFTIAIGLFGTPIVLGWSRQILLLTSRIWISAQTVPPDYGAMAVLSFYLIAISTIAIGLQRAVLAGRSFTTITGKGFRPRLIDLGPWRWATFAVTALYIVLTILAPVAVLLAAALSSYTWSNHYSLDNLVQSLSSDDVWSTMRNSVLISLFSATVATAIGLGIAWLVVRTRIAAREVIEYLVLLPISIPGIAFGVGVMLVWIRAPVPVYGTALIIVLAFVGRFTAYAVRSISASLIQVHPELEESARVFGLGPVRAFMHVTLPLIVPSIVAGWLLLFSFYMTELSMVVLLYSAGSRTFSVLSFEVWNVGDFSRLAAFSLLQLLIGLLLTSIIKAFFRDRIVQ